MNTECWQKDKCTVRVTNSPLTPVWYLGAGKFCWNQEMYGPQEIHTHDCSVIKWVEKGLWCTLNTTILMKGRCGIIRAPIIQNSTHNLEYYRPKGWVEHLGFGKEMYQWLIEADNLKEVIDRGYKELGQAKVVLDHNTKELLHIRKEYESQDISWWTSVLQKGPNKGIGAGVLHFMLHPIIVLF
ncbi:hypothetical protein FKM82_031187 [Ascaphus truei]